MDTDLILVGLLAASAGLVAYRAVRRSTRRHGVPEATEDPRLDYAPRTEWSSSRGRLNYSAFAYFDQNRDGRYSVDDRPLAGIAVRLVGEGGGVTLARTNATGFANFPVTSSGRDAPIHRPGRYEFRLSVPAGWQVTGGDAVQERTFVATAGSPAGLGTGEALEPIGLAPERVVRGRLASGEGRIVAEADGRELGGVAVSAREPFLFRLPTGAESVRISANGIVRRFVPREFPVDVGVVDPKRGALRPARVKEVVGFDGVTTLGLKKVPSGYRGLNWFNLNAMSREHTAGSLGYVNGNTSGTHVAYISSGYPAEVSSASPFDLIRVALTGAWLEAEAEAGIIECWRGDKLIARDRVVLSTLCPVDYTPLLPDVTRIRFSTAHSWQMVIGDLTIAR